MARASRTSVEQVDERGRLAELLRAESVALTEDAEDAEDAAAVADAPLSDAVIGRLFGRFADTIADQPPEARDAVPLERRAAVVRSKAAAIEDLLAILGVRGPYRSKIALEEETGIVAGFVYTAGKMAARIVDANGEEPVVGFFGPEKELLERAWAIQSPCPRR